MKKLSKLLVAAVVLLGVGFTACNSDEISTPTVDGQDANTHVAVAFSLGKTTRSVSDEQEYNYIGSWAGKDEIQTVDIFLVDGSTVSVTNFTLDNYEPVTNADNTIYLKPKTAIKTTSGLKTVYVLVNATDDVTEALSATSAANFKAAYETSVLRLANEETTATTSASKLIGTATEQGKEVITMTNLAGVSINVAPNVTEDETLADTNPANRASVQVERAVARVMVTTAKTEYDVPSANGSVSIGSLTDITWVVAQGENSLYVQRQNAWVTPSHGWNPGVGSDDFYSDAADKYDYSGLFAERNNGFGGTDVATYADYAAATDEGKVTHITSLDGQFLLPNTHAYASAPSGDEAYTGGYKKGNTAYVLVRAKFTPNSFADEGTPNPDGTFYLGGKDGLFYTSTQAAKDAGNTTTIAKYPEGKVLYYAWLNPDQKPNWYNSPVIRNNIYHIHITGFKTIGTNWNPLYPEDPDDPSYDPEDPNNPDPRPVPDDPAIDEPENPIDPEDPLTTPETYMSVDVTVLPWLVHSYEVDLGI